jgi:hypothetical protein
MKERVIGINSTKGWDRTKLTMTVTGEEGMGTAASSSPGFSAFAFDSRFVSPSSRAGLFWNFFVVVFCHFHSHKTIKTRFCGSS